MTAGCPHCRGSGMVGRGQNRRPCAACNAAAGGLGDRAAGVVQRGLDRLRGRRLEVEGRRTTRRDSRLGTETTTTRAPAKSKKKPAKRSPAAVQVGDCCGRAGGTLRMTGRGLHHVGGCPPE